MSAPDSASELLATLEPRDAGAHQVRFRFGPVAVIVSSPAADLLASLADYFRLFVGPSAAPTAPRDAPYDALDTTPAGGAVRVEVWPAHPPALDLPLRDFARRDGMALKEAWHDLGAMRLVRKVRTGMLFVFGADRHVAIGPCHENLNQVVNFINSRCIQWHLERGALLGHAAAVRSGSRGLAIAGISGAGKSTLALHVVSRGADFVSNDRVMVSRDRDELTLQGVAKHPRINPGTALHNDDLATIIPPAERERLRHLPRQALWELEQKYDARIDEIYGPERFALATPLQSLVLLHWRLGGGPMKAARINPEDHLDRLAAFAKRPGLFYFRRAGKVEPMPPLTAYAERLRSTVAVAIDGEPDFARAADLCLELLQEPRDVPTGTLDGGGA